MAATAAASIPLVDLSPFLSTNAPCSARQETAKEVADKCSQNGCLAITGHGIPHEFLDAAFNLQKKLFDLPMEDKMKAPHPAGMVPHRGYSAPGKERAFAKDDLDASDAVHRQMLRETQNWKESYEVGDDANHKDYNIWLPEDVFPGFRPLSTEIFHRLRRLSLGILDALVMGIGATEQEHAAITKQHVGAAGQLRFLHYLAMDVPQRRMMRREEVDRLLAHTDWSSFTLSFQDATGGLEFKDRRNGTFMPVMPRKDVVYLNIGDMMERFSNGLYPACTHRVVLPTKTKADNNIGQATNGSIKQKIPERYSLIYFAMVGEDAVVAPPASRVELDGFAKFEPIIYSDYAEERSRWHYEDYKDEEN